MPRLIVLLLAVGSTILGIVVLGPILMNELLRDVLGADAPTLSWGSWATFWAAIFIIRNMSFSIDIGAIYNWVNKRSAFQTEIDEIREIRGEVQNRLATMEQAIEIHHGPGEHFERREDSNTR